MRTRHVPPSSPRIERPPIFERRPERYVPDRDLTVYRDGLRWTFAGNKVCLNGRDVSRLISENSTDIAYWIGLADGLVEYRKKVASAAREIDQFGQFGRFEALVEALLGKILGRLKKVYDQKMSGISWALQNGQLILNGINVRSFLALYRIRKTDKAKRFLKGLKEKLTILLENRQQSPDYERIRDVVEEIYREIDEVLSSHQDGEAARPSRRGLPHSAGAS